MFALTAADSIAAGKYLCHNEALLFDRSEKVSLDGEHAASAQTEGEWLMIHGAAMVCL